MLIIQSETKMKPSSYSHCRVQRDRSRTNRAPLDALVVCQLEAIRNSEKQLQQSYARLVAAPKFKDSEACAVQVWKLRLQADRLARMLDALEGKYTADPVEKNTLAAA